MLEFYYGTTECCDSSFGALRESMSFYVDLYRKGSFSQNFHQLFVGHKSSVDQSCDIDFLDLFAFSQSLKRIEVDSFVFYAIDILNPNLGKRRCKGNLTTFETDFLL